MKKTILFDIVHPAHVHLFKNFIFYLKKNNYRVITVSRKKDITNRLLDYYNIEYISLSKPANNLFGMFRELLLRDYEIFKLHRKYKFDFAFGTSVSMCHLSLITKVKSFNFNEDDDDIVPLYSILSYPFATKIVNPTCIKYNRWKNKRVLHNSYHELAYLHPDNFFPDKEILKKYNLYEKKYIIIRLSALKAHHDLKAKGISKDLLKKIEKLIEECGEYIVIKSIENSRSHQIDPCDMHHVLAFAKMLISDSQSMTIEAAVLGVPAIRINTFIGKSTVIDDLENKYNLSFGFLPSQKYLILKTIKELLNDSMTDEVWLKRKKNILKDKIDFSKWMIDFFEDLCENRISKN